MDAHAAWERSDTIASLTLQDDGNSWEGNLDDGKRHATAAGGRGGRRRGRAPPAARAAGVHRVIRCDRGGGIGAAGCAQDRGAAAGRRAARRRPAGRRGHRGPARRGRARPRRDDGAPGARVAGIRAGSGRLPREARAARAPRDRPRARAPAPRGAADRRARARDRMRGRGVPRAACGRHGRHLALSGPDDDPRAPPHVRAAGRGHRLDRGRQPVQPRARERRRVPAVALAVLARMRARPGALLPHPPLGDRELGLRARGDVARRRPLQRLPAGRGGVAARPRATRHAPPPARRHSRKKSGGPKAAASG